MCHKSDGWLAGTQKWPSIVNAEGSGVMRFIIMTWKSDFPSLCKAQKMQGLIKILRLSHDKSKRCKAAHFWVSDEAALG